MGQVPLQAVIEVLREIEAAHPGAANRAPRASLRQVVALLEKGGFTTAQEIVAHLRNPSAAKAQKRAPDEQVVSVIHAELKRVQTLAELERTFERFDKNKKIRVGLELKAAVGKFFGKPVGDTRTKMYAALRRYVEAVQKNRDLVEQHRRQGV